MPEREPEALLICVVVVTYNTAQFWPRLKAALAAQTYPNWRLIVVDNASNPSQRLCQADLLPNATLIESEVNLGFAAANNLAVQNLEAPFIALLNPDAFPCPSWLSELAAAAGRWPNAAVIGSLQLRSDEPTIYDGEGDELHALGLPYRSSYGKRRIRPAPEGEAFSACAAAALYRMEDWRVCGGFDERFFSYCEDLDLAFRMRLRGRIAVQAPRAIVHHVGGGSVDQRSVFADFYGRRNRSWTFIKNTPALLFWPLLPLHILVVGFQLLVPRRSGDASWRGIRAAFADKRVWEQRRETQNARVASTWSIAKAMVWSPLKPARRSPRRAYANGAR